VNIQVLLTTDAPHLHYEVQAVACCVGK